MHETRGVSQVQFSFLPDQTADLRGGVWRVERWAEPTLIPVDGDVIRRDLSRAIYPWKLTGRDNDLFERLGRGDDVEVIGVSRRGGVEVARFPRVFRCRSCLRVELTSIKPCVCGDRHWTQVPFVAYHECGILAEPWIPKCKVHREVRAVFARTASARDIRLDCPVCGAVVSKGFPFVQCECGGGTLKYNIHRAAAVYVPRSTVIVNPPNEAVARQFRSEAAAAQTLSWALAGFLTANPFDGLPTVEALIADFSSRGIAPALAKTMADAAAKAAPGAIAASSTASGEGLDPERKRDAQESALSLAYAMAGGRMTVEELVNSSSAVLAERYERLYRPAVSRAGLRAVEFLPNFPVLTATYGYTRGDPQPGASTLRWYKGEKGALRIHGHRVETEGLLFHLDPLRVRAWLRRKGWLQDVPSDSESIRLALLRNAVMPSPGEAIGPATLGSDLLTLVHSYAHRAIRRIAAFAGIDRDALAEYLVPLQLSFVIYASARGDFVLGGLQALFEHDLEKALDEMTGGESRCALDPGCTKDGAACVACLHVGEPSCRFYNQHLSRYSLFGAEGFHVLA